MSAKDIENLPAGVSELVKEIDKLREDRLFLEKQLDIMRRKCIFMGNWLYTRNLSHECEKDYKESILAWGQENCFRDKDVEDNKREANGGLSHECN
jgi:hypothetical protein